MKLKYLYILLIALFGTLGIHSQTPGRNINAQQQLSGQLVYAPYGVTIIHLGESNALGYGAGFSWSNWMVNNLPAWKGRVVNYQNYGALGAAPADIANQYKNNNIKSYCNASTPQSPVYVIIEASLNGYSGNPQTQLSLLEGLWSTARNDGCKVFANTVRDGYNASYSSTILQLNTLIRGDAANYDALLDWFFYMPYDGCNNPNNSSTCPDYEPYAAFADTAHYNAYAAKAAAAYGSCVMTTFTSCGAPISRPIARAPEFTYQLLTTTDYAYANGKYVEVQNCVGAGINVNGEAQEGWTFTIRNLANCQQGLYTQNASIALEGQTPSSSYNQIGYLAPAGQFGDQQTFFYQAGVIYPFRITPLQPQYRSLLVVTSNFNNTTLGSDLIDCNGYNFMLGAGDVVGHTFTIVNSSASSCQLYNPGSNNAFINGAQNSVTIPSHGKERFVYVGPRTIGSNTYPDFEMSTTN